MRIREKKALGPGNFVTKNCRNAWLYYLAAWTFSRALNDNVRIAASIAGVAVGFAIASTDWVILIGAKALVGLKINGKNYELLQ